MEEKRRLTGWKIAILFVFVVVFFALSFILWKNYRQLRKTYFVNSFHTALEERLSHGPLQTNDVGIVSSWMTFNYINKIFNLPKDYLQASLQIKNVHYPNISISAYSKNDHQNVADVLIQVQNSIKEYLANKNI